MCSINDDTYNGSRDINLNHIWFWLPICYLWGDMHVYWTHRILHIPILYKYIHKTHHLSFNPEPFSSLSMHPVE